MKAQKLKAILIAGTKIKVNFIAGDDQTTAF